MPSHVIVDGSNLATEGRTLPSLHQLNEAIAAYRGDHPDALITVVVDATFGHRIDPKEVPEFEKAIETNAFVAPPAGAVGRGDGFILSIAQKAGASILSNDSYQEFHGEYAWLFDEGRLIGGKPVPHVGWVFVNRVPVRGPVSRRSVKEQKVVDKSPNRRRGRSSTADTTPAISADGPMPVPKAPPPGAVLAGQRSGREPRGAEPRHAESAKATQDRGRNQNRNHDRGQERSNERGQDQRQPIGAPKSVNDLLAFLSFVEHYPVGTAVTAIVESYSSHGAYVAIGDAKGYVPLRLMADPAPRSAREVMAIGETVTLVVSSFGPARRSIDLAVPAMAPAAPPVTPAKARKSAAKKAAATAVAAMESGAADAGAVEAIVAEAVDAASGVETAAPKRGRKAAAKKASGSTSSTVVEASMPQPEAKPARTVGRKQPAKRSAGSGRTAAATAANQPLTFDSVFADEPAATAAPAPAPVAKAAKSPAKRGTKKAAATSATATASTATPSTATAAAEPPATETGPTAKTAKSASSKAASNRAASAKAASVPKAQAAGRRGKVAAPPAPAPVADPAPAAPTKKAGGRRRSSSAPGGS